MSSGSKKRNPEIISLSLKKFRQANPSRFTIEAPMERDAHLQDPFYPYSRVPSKGNPPPGLLYRAPIERALPTSESLSAISQSPW
jgi:hypothetical protein